MAEGAFALRSLQGATLGGEGSKAASPRTFFLSDHKILWSIDTKDPVLHNALPQVLLH